MSTLTYRYSLDKTSKKHNCPQCGRKRFVRVVDSETKEYLPDHIGRCDREGGCGYEYKWSEWKKETGNDRPQAWQQRSAQAPEPVQPVDFLPGHYLYQSLRNYEQNNFHHFLTSLFGGRIAGKLCEEYLIGTSRHWKGAAVFPQIDTAGNVRQIKIMLHNQATGKRVKEGATVEQYNRFTRSFDTITTERPCSLIYGKYIDGSTKALNLQQVFFGQHLLAESTNEQRVCITESEKTAIIASVYMPGCVWLATGGASGCRWREYETYQALKGRSVTFFPDHGIFNKKTGKTCYQEWCDRVDRIREAIPGRFRVSDLLEKRLGENLQDQDLADLLLIRDQTAGVALTDAGYPVMWDYNTEVKQ
ncbi:hypothetical protein SAMN05444008_10938 [Cnuella takakiae]|uniref:Toprim-like n=1 Tax=Cnuella takakiae TaxID=1302690 RepID=A0A1M5CEH4_9BACT|nr:DUF6371 domain-containing protein [Cnuella takakiae]OLY91790.1 hypothetical protein BUE76_07675 [Cnuella takakiae]SHF53174.1 hypothetical protein SAMN05444008_10938 [Cnuella takakiae]